MDETSKVSESDSIDSSADDLDEDLRAIAGNSVVVGEEDVLAEVRKQALAKSGASDDKRKALAKYQQLLKELRIRIGTLLKMDNVSFLLGAGCSTDAGGVSLASIPIQVESQLLEQGIEDGISKPWLDLFYNLVNGLVPEASCDPEQRKEAICQIEASCGQEGDPATLQREEGIERLVIGINLEEFLSKLHTWRAAIIRDGITLTTGADTQVKVRLEDIEDLVSRLTVGLAQVCQLPLPGREGALDVHRRMMKKPLTRPLNLRRVNLYTLNYDTLLEQAADAEGVVLVDGFLGTLRRVFRPESFDQDFYFPAQTTEGRVHRLDRVMHLYKLHGSITWHRSAPTWENPYGLYATFFNERSGAEDVLIYPTPLKYGEALALPYSELFRRFASTIVQPQSVLIVIGYGFGDEHVNALIRQALAIPSFTLVIVDPSGTNAFVNQLKTQRDQRVWIITGRGNYNKPSLWGLGTFRGFVEHLLPDLREEDILQKVVSTYRAISQDSSDRPFGNGGNHDDE